MQRKSGQNILYKEEEFNINSFIGYAYMFNHLEKVYKIKDRYVVKYKTSQFIVDPKTNHIFSREEVEGSVK